MDTAFSTLVGGLDFRLWLDEPSDSVWRTQGRTRALLIDDQFPGRRRFFLDENRTHSESLLEKWLNVELEFLESPDDCKVISESVFSGTFDESWFEDRLKRVLKNPVPIAAIFLDLLFGDKEGSIDNASGVRFLKILAHRLPDVPLLILSNMPDTNQVMLKLKESGSVVSFVKKHDEGNPDQKLVERIAHKLVEFGDLADLSLAAFSFPMRRIACDLRRIAIRDERIPYEESEAGNYPKPVVLIGEYGSGKNFLAKRLFTMSRRRSKPFVPMTFTNMDQDSAITSLFGILGYTDAPEHYYTDIRTGAVVIRGSSKRRVRDATSNEIIMGGIGNLQLADMGDVPGPYDRPPLQGTVLLDELGIAPEIQRRFLGVLNRGRYSPKLGNREIPTERSLDLWYLVPSTQGAFDGMSPDLRSRLARGHIVHIPSLAKRQEDVLALAIASLPGTVKTNPLFAPNGVSWLVDASSKFEVRDLNGLVGRLAFAATPPFNSNDLQRAYEQYVLQEGARRNSKTGTGKQCVPENRLIAVPVPTNTSDPFDTVDQVAVASEVMRIGNYEILEEVGRGNMGVVYRARQQGLNREVALKMILDGSYASERARRRFQKEAETIARLRHPNIVQIFEVGEHEGKPFFSMTFIKGQSLSEKGAPGPVDARKAARWIQQMAIAVQCAHDQHVLHRDLKPANILVDEEGCPWITDFGLAKWLDDEHGTTRTGDVMGTPCYMSPEQAAGQTTLIGPAADIYGLGAILYRLVAWRPPFAAVSLVEMLRQIREERPVPLRRLDPSLDRELDAICMRCLAKSPGDRYVSARDLADDLKRYLAGQPIQASPQDILDQVSADAAMDILKAIDQIMVRNMASHGAFSIVSLYRLLTGQESVPDANTCRSRLARFLLLHEKQTLKAIHQSERLALLATDLAKRNTEIKRLLRQPQ